MSALRTAAVSLAQPGQPLSTFKAVEAAAQSLVGHRLFTLMTWYESSGEAQRIYSSNPDAYPVGGRKAMADTPFGEAVLKVQKPYLGRTKADIQWAFFDHELIFSLGLGSVINCLVRYDGALLGTMNMLHEEYYYREKDLETAAPLAALLVPAFLQRMQQPA